MDIGGIQSVIVSQIGFLIAAGYQIILVLDNNTIDYILPKGLKIEILPVEFDEKLDQWRSILKRYKVDTYIDHGILYDQSWPRFNEIAKQLEIKSIGWIHSAFHRPVLDFSTQGVFLDSHISSLNQLIVLSDTDAAYYQLLGHSNVRFLPNPPSPSMAESMDHGARVQIANNNKVELLWVGRAQQKAKKIFDLIPFMGELVKEVPNAHLSIVGPFTWDIAETEYINKIQLAGLEKNISLLGPKTQEELPKYYKKADIAVNTSIIEGFPLTLVEENFFGLPIVMYELPWLWFTKNNQGIRSVPQGDYVGLVESILEIMNDLRLYRKMSLAGLTKAREVLSIDFVNIYDNLVKNTLPKTYTPDPNLEEAGIILRLYNSSFAQIRNEKQAESESLSANIHHKQGRIHNLEQQITGFMEIRRSARLLLGNIKRKLRIRTRIKNIASCSMSSGPGKGQNI